MVFCSHFEDILYFLYSLNYQFSHSVMSNSLIPHGLQHARLRCPSPTLGAFSNSWPLSRWCYPTISSSVIPFFSCFQSFPVSGSFPRSQFFPSGGQSIGISVSTSILPRNSVQCSRSVMSDSLHTRPPCPSPSPRVHPDPRPLSLWCHPAISSWVNPFSSCPQSESFPMSRLFSWGG